MKRRLFAFLLAACMIVGVMAGCASDEPEASPSQSGNNADPSDNGNTSTPSFTAEYDWQELEEGAPEPSYGGDLTLVLSMRPDFYLPGVSGKGTQMLLCPAIESIGRQLDDGTWVPFLAESWEEDAENATFTIKLREGIKFHDGSELNAEVLAWDFEEMLASGRKTDLCNPTSIEVADEYTVVMHFEEYSNAWIETIGMARIVSKYSYETYGEDYMKVNAIGTGPFVQSEFIEGTSITFTKNEDYWQEGLPYLDSITFVQMTDTNTQISAMLNGEIQGVDVRTGSVAAQMEAIDGLKNITNATGATVGFTHINMNMADTPFADVLVRQAIMYGLDRESSAQGVTEGLGHALNQYAVEGSYAYLEDPTYTYDYDPEKAKELLTEAGYPNGFDTTIDTSTLYEKQAVALQSYLDAIGINAEIKMNDTATLTDLEQGGTFAGMTVMSGSVASNDPTNFIDRLMGPNRTRFLASALQDEDFFTLLTEEPYAKTTEERNEYCQQIGKYINENLPILPWYYMANPYYVVDNLYGTHYYSVQAWQWTPDTAYLAA